MSKGQKHQNTEAWVPNRADKHNSLQQLVNKLPSGAEAGLCQKCDEVVAWKKQFGKYKPLKQPAKCVASMHLAHVARSSAHALSLIHI